MSNASCSVGPRLDRFQSPACVELAAEASIIKHSKTRQGIRRFDRSYEREMQGVCSGTTSSVYHVSIQHVWLTFASTSALPARGRQVGPVDRPFWTVPKSTYLLSTSLGCGKQFRKPYATIAEDVLDHEASWRNLEYSLCLPPR